MAETNSTSMTPQALMAALEAQSFAADKKVADLKALLEKKEAQVTALSAEVEEAQKKVRKAYREANEKRFSDFNFKHALVGATIRHTISVAGVAKYVITVPNGAAFHSVDQFIMKPVNKEGIDMSPISETERVLLAYLVALHYTYDEKKPQPEQDLTRPEFTLAMRLGLIRQLPASTAARLADECMNLQAYLNVVLEEEMGN